MSILNAIKWRLVIPKLSRIKLLVLDVDGVLTDGGLFYTPNGDVIKRFDVKDGLGIKLLQESGIEVAFLSGGLGGSTELRASHLKIKKCFFNVKDKSSTLRELQQELGISKENTCYVGDDLNDLVVKSFVKFFIVSNNAPIELKRLATCTLKNSGGYGAIREISDKILQSKNLLDNYYKVGWINNNI